MTQSMKKALALLLSVVQLFLLLPLGVMQADAVQTEDNRLPRLNPTIVGTVQFQSFNFLGDNETGEDGTDYTTTFYYSDDYFSPSAINDAADSKTMLWSDLDNPSLATCSMDFAVAAMTSADGDVLTATSRTWDNSDYSAARKEKNVRAFLSACGFTDVECTDLNKRPTNDSIGYTIGSKQITVWNDEMHQNEQYTLIAVGVRGAGYGQEWASNISIGNPANGELPDNGRHYGFDSSAVKVCDAIRRYLSQHSINGNVKYWVTGFSRAAAVANLVAGYLTDGGSAYQTQKKDVYGYTWECPQAASTSENALDYKNIHNILNPMDAVPKVSPDKFEHQRLGVDYQMPYHGTPNLSPSTHTAMYNRMFEVLKTIATGSKYTREKDPLVDDPTTSDANDGYVSPNVYPYNKPITIYKMDGSELIGQVASYYTYTNISTYLGSDKLLKEFGTVQAYETYYTTGLFGRRVEHTGNVQHLLGKATYNTTNLYIDSFIDDLIDVFLKSNAWEGGTGIDGVPVQNRDTFIRDYQDDFRDLFGYFLDYAGPAFLGIIDQLIEAVTKKIGTAITSGFAGDFVNFYKYPSDANYKRKVIASAKTMAVEVANELTSGFTDPQNITRERMNEALQHVVEVVFNLYSFELSNFDSQYLGTTLRYLWEILCTHEQETVLSWIMSLDKNHMNRNCRTLTIPRNCNAKLLEFREQYAQYEGSMEDANAKAPVVAEWNNGVFTSKDERITYTASSSPDYIIIRYPASLDIRTDVTSGENLDLRNFGLDDYRTVSETDRVSVGESQYQVVPLADTASSTGFQYVTQNSTYSNAKLRNQDLSAYATLEAGDTLHIIANGTDTFSQEMTYDLIVDKVADVTLADYGTTSAAFSAGTEIGSAVRIGAAETSSVTEITVNRIRTRQAHLIVPASSIYYDDELTAADASDYQAETARLDVDPETGESISRGYWIGFRGERIDVYCTTKKDAGYMTASVGTVDEDGNYQVFRDEAGNRKVQTIKNQSETTRYNVPTISFDGLDPNTDYVLRIYAMKDSDYRLDGIRVYHSANESDTAVAAAYEAAGEQDAKYVNLRALLLGSVNEGTLSGDDANVAEGALFYTDIGTSYALSSDDYVANSPKNEIYLAAGESVAFQIVGTYEKVAVGMSAPESKTGGGSVTMTNGSGTKTQPIANALDQYYTVTPAPDGSVVISNPANSTALISITNVKLSGGYTEPVTGQSLEAPLMVSKSLMRYAAAFSDLPAVTDEPEETPIPEETPAPAPTPTPEPTPSPTPTATPEPTPTPANPSSDSSVMQLISSYVKSLFGGFSRLFRP